MKSSWSRWTLSAAEAPSSSAATRIPNLQNNETANVNLRQGKSHLVITCCHMKRLWRWNQHGLHKILYRGFSSGRFWAPKSQELGMMEVEVEICTKKFTSMTMSIIHHHFIEHHFCSGASHTWQFLQCIQFISDLLEFGLQRCDLASVVCAINQSDFAKHGTTWQESCKSDRDQFKPLQYRNKCADKEWPKDMPTLKNAHGGKLGYAIHSVSQNLFYPKISTRPSFFVHIYRILHVMFVRNNI